MNPKPHPQFIQQSLRCVATTADVCGEGAVWHPDHNSLYWADINRHLLHRLRLADGTVATWTFDQPVTALALTTDPEKLLVVLGGRIILWEPSTGAELKTLHHLTTWPTARCNDARVDPAGILWVGTMQNNVAPDGGARPMTADIGELFSLDAAGATRLWLQHFGITNTLAWSPDHTVFYFADTQRNTIFRYPYHAATQTIGEQSVFCSGFERGLPDGSAMDAEGYLWNCRYGGGCIVRFAPDGSVDRVIDTPVRNPTTCAFAGADLQTLFFTSANAANPDSLEDGGLFAIDTPYRGLPATPFII